MIDSSPYTFPQFLNGLLHFFVASYVAKYSALSSAVSLGNNKTRNAVWEWIC